MSTKIKIIKPTKKFENHLGILKNLSDAFDERKDRLGTSVVHLENRSCGDSLEVSMVQKGKGKIVVKLKGEGCVVMKASAQWMSEKISNHSRLEVVELVTQILNSETKSVASTTGLDQRDILFKELLMHYPGRKTCVHLPWHGLKKLINKKKTK